MSNEQMSNERIPSPGKGASQHFSTVYSFFFTDTEKKRIAWAPLFTYQIEGLPGADSALRPEAGVGADKVHAGPTMQRVEVIVGRDLRHRGQYRLAQSQPGRIHGIDSRSVGTKRI